MDFVLDWFCLMVPYSQIVKFWAFLAGGKQICREKDKKSPSQDSNQSSLDGLRLSYYDLPIDYWFDRIKDFLYNVFTPINMH